MEDHIFSAVHTTVFKESENLEGKCTQIQGYDFNQGLDYSRLIDSLFSTGFQASIIGDAVEVVNQMVGFSSLFYVFFFFFVNFVSAYA